MKKIAWLAPVLVLTPLAFAGACGGEPADMDGSGGADGTGGNNPTGGAPNTGGSDGAGGSTGGAPVTGGTAGMGAMGGTDACSEPSDEEVGMGGFGGSSTELIEICEIRCSHAIACGAAGCDHEQCVTECSDTFPYDYYYNCIPEFTALKACEAENLSGDDYACDETFGTVFATTAGVAKCQAENDAFDACYE